MKRSVRLIRGCSVTLQAKPRRATSSIHTSSQCNSREKNVVYSPFPAMELPTETLPSLMFTRAARWSHFDAIECGITGRKYTYGEMIDRSLKWGTIVNKAMPPPSSSSSSSSTFRNLVLYSPNCPEFPIVFLGTQAVGATITTMNINYTVDEVARQLDDCDASVVVVDPKYEKVLRAAFAKLKKSLPVFVNGVSEYGSPNFREIIANNDIPFADLVEMPTESICTMLYSSGTTGKPKGVALSHRAFTANLATFLIPAVFPYRQTTAEYQETVTGILPFYHVYGAHVINMFSLYLGAKIVSLPAFTPNDFVRIIKEHKVEILHLVPPMLNFLVNSPAVTSDDLSTIRVAMCAAAPVPIPSAMALKEKAPNPILFQEGFGMTEVLGTHMTPIDQEKIGSCGKLVPNIEAKVVDIVTGEVLPEGQRGELCIRTPSAMSYYHKNPEATAVTIDAEGWLHTGDVALHEDGFFSIVDRIKELIKVKGAQVSPSELEEVLLKHPGVIDAGVVGVPDDRAGELPRAYIVRKSETTAEDIQKFMEDRVASHKQLKGGIRFVESLPKNATGKLLRRQLKEMAAKDL